MDNVDINKLKLYLDYDFSFKKQSKITSFSDVNLVYKWTNEKMSLYPDSNLENKKVLTVTSSGDHSLEAILNGAKEIDSIDINIFCKYYSALKIAMIKKYDYDEFFYKIDQVIDYASLISIDGILNDVCLYLTEEEQLFWNEYNKYAKKSIFCACCYPQKNRYYEKDNYYTLKERLDDVTINYYDGDIINIDDILKGKKYDCIYLSNIIERIHPGFLNIVRKLIKKMSNHMNDDGAILSYFFDMELAKNGIIQDKCIKKIKGKYDFEYFINEDANNYFQNGVVKIMKK